MAAKRTSRISASDTEMRKIIDTSDQDKKEEKEKKKVKKEKAGKLKGINSY